MNHRIMWSSLFLFSFGCGGTQEAPAEAPPAPKVVVKIHPGESWYKYRGERLGLSLRQAKQRDDAISAEAPPANFWDDQTSVEAAGVWSQLCNDCHGGRRKVLEAKSIEAPPSTWGTSEGYFFGRKRNHKEIFQRIAEGIAPDPTKPENMPAWGNKLSREQIWSLIYFIEYSSGGVSGRFPPGLYPKSNSP